MHWPPHRILHSIRSSQSDPFPLSPANRPDSVHPTNSLLRASPSPRFRSGSPSSSVPRSRSGYCSHSVHSGHCDALHAPNRYETHLKSRHEPRGIDRRKSAARALSVESEGHKIWTNAIGGVESALFIARSAISGEIISKNTSAIKWTTDGQWAATNDAANGQNAHHFVSASLPKHCNQCRGGMALRIEHSRNHSERCECSSSLRLQNGLKSPSHSLRNFEILRIGISAKRQPRIGLFPFDAVKTTHRSNISQ